VNQDEFRLVSLPEPARSCLACVSNAYLLGRARPHADAHRVFPARLPPVWRVVGAVRGDPIPLGTTLRLVEACHQVFPQDHQMLRTESIEWLLAPIDGTQAGEIYHVWTWDRRDENVTGVIPRGGAGDPRWPTGLEPTLAE
jgi:hypothetical protein